MAASEVVRYSTMYPARRLLLPPPCAHRPRPAPPFAAAQAGVTGHWRGRGAGHRPPLASVARVARATEANAALACDPLGWLDARRRAARAVVAGHTPLIGVEGRRYPSALHPSSRSVIIHETHPTPTRHHECADFFFGGQSTHRLRQSNPGFLTPTVPLSHFALLSSSVSPTLTPTRFVPTAAVSPTEGTDSVHPSLKGAQPQPDPRADGWMDGRTGGRMEGMHG
eukprot:gene11790-biopygen10936